MGNRHQAFIIMMILSGLIFLDPFRIMGAGMIKVEEKDNGKTISVTNGQTVRISLETNPTTGFEWHVVQEPDPSVLKRIDHFLISQGSLPGSPSQECWDYQWAGGGNATLELRYDRSWEKNVPPLKIFAVHFIGQK